MQDATVTHSSTFTKLALTAVVVSASVMLVAATALPSQRYYMVDELLATGDLSRWGRSELKVHGWVIAGTIKETVIELEIHRTFLLQKSGKKIRVFARGPAPDTFKDQSEVVAVGTLVPSATMMELADELDVTLDGDYVLDATDLLSKCVSRYETATTNKNVKFE